VIERAGAIARICRDHGVPMAAAALRFPLFEPLVASVIPGPRSPTELAQILEWYETPIPTALWHDLRAAGLLHPEAAIPEERAGDAG
jgi:D-threo-aldose 1-dehydrogenase